MIELLVAIAIIGVLASSLFFVLNPKELLAKGRDAQRKSDFGQIRNALEAYYNDNNRYPDGSGNIIAGVSWGDSWVPYMTKLPKDPSSPGQDYKYETDVSGTYYRLYAKLERCSDPQVIPGSDCDNYNYSVTSTNVAIVALPTHTPTPTPLPYKRVFATSRIYDGNLGGLAGGDSKCQTRADDPDNDPNTADGLGGTWKAWLSDEFQSPSTRFTQSSIPYALVNGVTIASKWDDLINGTLAHAINMTETRVNPPTGVVFTGTNANATGTGPNCTNWTTVSGDGRIGVAGETSSQWSNRGDGYTWACGSGLSIYCFEQ